MTDQPGLWTETTGRCVDCDREIPNAVLTMLPNVGKCCPDCYDTRVGVVREEPKNLEAQNATSLCGE